MSMCMSMFSFFFFPNVGMRCLPNILPSVNFPNFGKCVSCFSCFCFSRKNATTFQILGKSCSITTLIQCRSSHCSMWNRKQSYVDYSSGFQISRYLLYTGMAQRYCVAGQREVCIPYRTYITIPTTADCAFPELLMHGFWVHILGTDT